ncbi:TPR [Pyrrhoderma noxium]|uniref:TPR n=1 Tax=Pyrrhoderma noxium TaxID=2282107 RepID=A0A286UKG8_9AGAM|nr:TPR [Pyrrhoderma noxium]
MNLARTFARQNHNLVLTARARSPASSPLFFQPRRFFSNRSPSATSVATLHPLTARSPPFLLSGRHIIKRFATSTTPHSTTVDPAETEANEFLERGTQRLEEGDIEGAKELYRRSVDIRRDAGALFNLGVTHYHLKEFDDAINAWKESIQLQPNSADAHTNLASAYIISPLSRPDLALHHLRIASSLAPDDPEIAFNLAAVLEACGRLEEALVQYKRSKENGVDRAEVHIRNVSAKILGQKMKEAGESK